MKKTVRDAICDLGIELCKMADRSTEQAKIHALSALDEINVDDRRAALEHRAMAGAYMVAVKRVDELRFAIERGDFQ